MSWSYQAVGRAEDFPKALDAESERLTGQSKEEFEAAKPHLLALIGLNGSATESRVLDVRAHGHAVKTDGKTTSSSCGVEIKPFTSRLL